MKTCRKCQTEKDISNYRQDKNSRDKLMSICRSCDNKRKAGWYANKKTKQKRVETDVYGVPTVCLCPKCRELHRKTLNWIGRGIPRIRCDGCNRHADVFEYTGDALPAPVRAQSLYSM